MPVIKVNVKWNGKKFDNIELNTDESALVFKSQLLTLTNVDVERQKIMIKGGMLKDDTNLNSLNIPEGHTFLMMGTAGELPKPPAEKVKFIEDMNEEQLAEVVKLPAGLTNLGNTCYMNATLQCLKTIPELGTSLQSYQVNQGDNRSSLVLGLRLLFDQLSKTTQPVTPAVFLQLLRVVYPQFSQQGAGGVFMQQDAEECYSQLVSLLRESSIKISKGENSEILPLVEKYMSGTFVSSLASEEAPSEAPVTSTETFTKVSCHISSAVNYLTDGLTEALTEKIEKNSPSLNRQAVYTKKTLIGRLPKYLTVNFVRFFWKPQERVKAKILRKVKFPVTLDMYPFCTDELKAKLESPRQRIKEVDDIKKGAKKAKVDGEEEIKYGLAENPDVGSNGTGFYELAAVLTHIGRSSDAGHYMAWTRDGETDNWWKFDDDKISTVKTEDILKLDGGGDWHMAYLLLYREKEFK